MTSLLPAPRLTDPRNAPVLRWGILAPGEIAHAFVSTVLRNTDQSVVAVASRNPDRAAAFAAAYGIERHYGSYEQLVEDPEVDVVYVAAPHSEHTRLALLAIAAGKHVLIEKPIAPTAAEATIIVDAARGAGVFAMEAMWTRYLPQSDIVRQLLDQGRIGPLALMTADFGFAATYDPSSRLFDPALAGGALLDLGIYVVSWAAFVLGAPATIRALGTLAPTGVDAQTSIVLGTPNGAQALLNATTLANTPQSSMIFGRDARIEMGTPFWSASGVRVVGDDNEVLDEWVDEFGRDHRDGLCYQAAALARYVGDGLTESPIHDLDETVSIMETLDEIRLQVQQTAPTTTNFR